MSKITVAVLFGGASAEHEVSRMSAVNVISGLSEEKYNIVPIYITKEGRWLLYDGIPGSIKTANLEILDTQAFLCPDTGLGPVLRIVGEKARNIPIDIVFPVLHGKNGEDGNIQGLCELAKIPYVGCGVLSSALCMDKQLTKFVAGAIGLKQVKHICFTREELEKDFDSSFRKVKSRLKMPCFVKPANTGSSIGISKAGDKAGFREAVTEALKYDRKILIEKAVTGRELEVSVLGNLEPKASGVGEIIVSGEFYDYNSKYCDENSKTITKPVFPDGVEEEIRSQALRIFKAVGGLGMARVDFFLDKESGEILFNEINTIPGFTAISMYWMLWQASGMTLQELCDNLIELGMERYKL